MNECTSFFDTCQETPVNFDSNDLSIFGPGNDTEKLLENYERQLYAEFGANKAMIEAKYNMMLHRVEKARVKWACITAKSQREENFKYENGCYYQVNTYQQMTEVKPKYERDRGIKPPDRTGEVIHRFTKRSRQRLMRKARTLNQSQMRIWNPDTQNREAVDYELPLPYFVTLTYHRNMNEPQQGKKDLNTFLQRFRRLSKYFAYVWKMEPQAKNYERTGRNAVHFHLAFFIPKSVFPRKWQKRSDRVEWLRARVSAAWNEIAEPGDNTHLQAGTNVRDIDNWKMFLGYIYKYFEKDINKNPWQGKETGRFWGFSYNLDFEALHIGFVDHADLQQIADFCNALNERTFTDFVHYMIQQAERVKQRLSGPKLKRKLEHMRNTFEAQKRRYMINKGKIEQGYMLQFEINAEKTAFMRELLQMQDFNKN